MMMNWNKQKSHHSLINHILPTSWISRLKPTKSSCDRAALKGNKTGQLGSPFSTEGRFYSADGDEAYWRLSFGDEEADTMKMFSRENSSKSYDVVCKPQFSPEKSAMRRKKVRGYAELKKHSFEGREEIAAEADQMALFEMQPERVICSTKNFCPTVASSPHTLNSKLRAVIVEDYSENEHRRIRKCQKKRRKVGGRSKSYSPRTGARTECKIKALEDLKKAKKMKKKKNEREPAASNTDTEGEEGLGDLTGLDGYAVIKNSANPQEDFRESMVEMILEKDIERPEELEELLTCYLTLNDDKYHDLIVKVFREVWLQLNEICIASMLQDECFYQY